MKKEKSSKKNFLVYIVETPQVSPETVSRVLNNNPNVKEKTGTRVMALVEKLGFRKNLPASSLRSKKTNTIGLIVPQISMYVHAEIITTIQNELHRFGYNLIISQVAGYSNDPRSAIISPSITTIDRFPAKIGKIISEEVIKTLKPGSDTRIPTKPIITPVELIRRMST